MADEIKVNIAVNVENGAFKHTIAPGQIEIDQAAIGRFGSTQVIGTSEEVVAVGDVSTNGCLYLRNLDATNYVEFGPESGGAMVTLGKLKAGENAWLRLKPGVVLRAQANTAAVKLQVDLFED